MDGYTRVNFSTATQICSCPESCNRDCLARDEYQQARGLQLGPAKADDVEKVPQLTRLFVPSLNTLSEKYTITTPLGVDDLVNHCYAVGYSKAESSDLHLLFVRLR
jgi:hypothetical protein